MAPAMIISLTKELWEHLVFSLYAATEAYQVIGMQDDEVENFFLKRVHHLENENETGRLSNHQALAGLAAYNVFLYNR